MRKSFFHGITHGIPIALGYLSVSFGFGILAVNSGLSVLEAAFISITNLTSAGQAAGISIIASGGTLFEMALTQFVINIRYSLMSLSLSQKLDESFDLPKRMIASYGITDEIFAVASVYDGKLKPAYMYGLILISCLGWTGGTIAGACAGEFLPKSITSAMGIVLYGMFIAIIIPPARKNKAILFIISVAALVSLFLKYFCDSVSSGFAVIISALISAVLGALVFPVDDKEEEA